MAVDDDEVLGTLVSDMDNIFELTNNKRTALRNMCLYLKKAYKIALQHMNSKTWKECCHMCVVELDDAGIHFIKNEKSVRRWHISYRQHDLINIPNL